MRNRIVVATPGEAWADGVPGGKYGATIATAAMRGAGLVLTPLCAVLPEGRVSPRDLGLWSDEQAVQWQDVVRVLHAGTDAKIGVQLGHAGRRGATRSRAEGLDRPLREDGWPLLSASALPYTPTSQLPREMSRADMDEVCKAFVLAAQWAEKAGFDLLQLPMAHGYLLASFLSPLTNRREDEYGGSLDNRARYPLEVLGAVRAVWPEGKPLSVALNANDYARGGLGTGDAVEIARLLKAAGCDLVQVLAGQTTAMSAPPYARGFLTPLSDRVRNEAGVPTMVGGYLTTSNEANTILAAGRADLCVMEVQ